MINVTNKNRDKIIEEYVCDLIDGMDWDTMYAFCYERLIETKSLMVNEDLESEIMNFFPYILEN
jgi:hypothetical protein